METTKEVLAQYCDLRKEIEEVRQRIKKIGQEIGRIEKEGKVVDVVRGGSGGNQHYKIEGFPYPEYKRMTNLLRAKKAILSGLEMKLLEMLNQVEEFIANLDDSRMRRIISLRFIDNLSWNEVADCIGGGNTAHSIKKAFYRFMEQ